MDTKTRIAASVLVTAGAMLVLAGCGLRPEASAPPSTSGSAQPPASSGEPATATVVVVERPDGEQGAGPRPCTRLDVEPELAVGDQPPGQESWDTTLYVTNVSTDTCRLEGRSGLHFYAETGAPIERDQKAPEGDGPADDPVVVGPGESAEMHVHYGSAPEDTASGHCPSPTSAGVLLPGDSQELEVAPPEDFDSMPPLCGEEMQVSPWAASVR